MPPPAPEVAHDLKTNPPLRSVRWLSAIVFSAPLACGAHTFGTVYNLPVPFWMYAYGASAALIVSFAIVAYFASVTSKRGASASAALQLPQTAEARAFAVLSEPWVFVMRIFSALALMLTIVAGFVGITNSYANINMTLFWIVFVLACFYLAAIVGDLYEVANPWRTLCEWAEHVSGQLFRPRFAYPRGLGYYPAFILYGAFICLELFGQIQAHSLSIVLIVYTALNAVGAALIGKDVWFRYGEFFGVIFRLAGKIAPIEYVKEKGKLDRYRVRFRKPFAGLLEESADDGSLILFILFMLSSTAFDGIHETVPWVSVFWKQIYPLLAASIDRPYDFMVNFYYYWQWAMLFISPFAYLLVYLGFVWLAKLATKSQVPVSVLAAQFAFSLIPIAFVYNVSHYYTLVVSQGVNLFHLVSDPFGLGWDLFGTQQWMQTPVILDAGGVWLTQVALILFGHIAGVFVAHVEALKRFPDPRPAILSQLPMLLLMVLFTTVGLWILSLPIAGGQIVQPPSST